MHGEKIMPIIKVWCLPCMSENELNQLYNVIVNAVESISELGLKGQKAITVLFPTDSMALGLGEEVIIEVTGLFKKPERTPALRQRIARELGQAIAEVFPETKIECFIYSFDPAEGFWSSSETQNCSKCGGEIDYQKPIPMHVGCACSGISQDSFSCKQCGLLHWENGNPILNGQSFLINGKITHKHD
ncbi:hypothetical protein M0R01_01775 [bacterium]|nr:hypothetical protein [bacterium]